MSLVCSFLRNLYKNLGMSSFVPYQNFAESSALAKNMTTLMQHGYGNYTSLEVPLAYAPGIPTRSKSQLMERSSASSHKRDAGTVTKNS